MGIGEGFEKRLVRGPRGLHRPQRVADRQFEKQREVSVPGEQRFYSVSYADCRYTRIVDDAA